MLTRKRIHVFVCFWVPDLTNLYNYVQLLLRACFGRLIKYLWLISEIISALLLFTTLFLFFILVGTSLPANRKTHRDANRKIIELNHKR